MNILTSIRNKVFGQPETNVIEFVKVKDVKSPNRGTSLSAGLDFYVPNDYTTLTIEPNKSVLIPSGIHVKMDPEYVLIAFNKSGIASKKSLIIGACVTADTIIETNKGKFSVHELTKEFVKNNNILIKSYNTVTENIEYKDFCGFLYNGNKETVELTFDNNNTINCSIDHKILTSNRSWVEAQNILETDDIISF